MIPKSFYDLRFGVSPGAARKDAHHICGSLDEVKSALDFELEASINVWLLFAYSSGADVALDVYQQGEMAESIDLHPFMTVRVEGYPDITFLGRGKPTGYAAGSDDPDSVEMALAEGLPDYEARMRPRRRASRRPCGRGAAARAGVFQRSTALAKVTKSAQAAGVTES
ncbi:hypothetical protein OG946_29920 [Streptomyces sp. NBC_01808]|uniref:hypothetical protein n=1 Tax=Streptomyces sp. NBC_01808 TaxID=2975947 RepID=UPI002DDA50DE|nr:hypothetical protein [Streptomyces sp. NBC_01808]WSA41226.1 hypothetical protein OG946_29920 [Streptomyces sp. NBC_01808]